MTASPAHHLSEKAISPTTGLAILDALVLIASNQIAEQLDGFVLRLSEALAKASDHTVRVDDGEIARNALHHLTRNRLTFHRLVSSCLSELISREIVSITSQRESKAACEAMDLSLVTFEAMEHKVLLDNLSQALDAANVDTLNALTVRIAHLLQRYDINAKKNPFRPETFLNAISDAWCQFDLNTASHLLVMRQMRPEIFLHLEPVLKAMNDALVAHGILPNLADAYRLQKPARNTTRTTGAQDRNLPFYSKLDRWLAAPSNEAMHGGRQPYDGGATVHPGLFHYLTDLQKKVPQQSRADRTESMEASASILRQVMTQAPPGTLTQVDVHAIELLAGTFDYVFREHYIPAAIKTLVAQLQVPLLKAALADKEFFFREDHPARRLLDTVAKSSVACDPEKGPSDPLYQMIEQIVERVQQEYDQQIGLFDDAVNDLEAFLAQEAQASGDALSQTIAEAGRQEKINRAKDWADNEVAIRIETGEVAGFLEAFLETQWTRILGLAYSVQDTKPEALQSAIKTMDDLIWSVKHKCSPKERKELVSKLPAMLSMVNAWLNAVKWDGPDRVQFFSTLAERHAAVVRTALELSPRHQLEITMNVAQKASELRLDKHATGQTEKPADRYVYLVDALELDAWLEFQRNNGTWAKFKLAWVSPHRTRFVFSGRQGKESFTLACDELAQLLRDQKAAIVAADAIVDRALAAALEEIQAA